MKKIIFAALALVTLAFTACDDNKMKILDYGELPARAQQTLSEYFADGQIAVIKKDYDDWGVRYEVIFSNANEVEFDKKGEWRDINCRATRVPEGLVPLQIRQYVDKSYPGAIIWELGRDSHGYDVVLNNMIELDFDLDFNIIDIDRED